ncbi:hypothetical protein scyTo_0000841 [Scyliorhinus torazame]|uniref:ribonuclease H n=1 Tax=Scyliorhinus torazame TaxID=75743 RepID=A0A401P513_SCYTO|nr:hypothetical protein [Scyliorhinus torazame]
MCRLRTDSDPSQESNLGSWSCEAIMLTTMLLCCPQVMEGIKGVRVYVDDVIIWSTTPEEHVSRLQQVFRRVHTNGLKLNRAKCCFGMSTLEFLRDQISQQGVCPDKVKAIPAMKVPEVKKAVLCFLGMVNFLGKFIRNMASYTMALRNLVKTSTAFECKAAHQAEWLELKANLTTAPVLAFSTQTRKQKSRQLRARMASVRSCCNTMTPHPGHRLPMHQGQ